MIGQERLRRQINNLDLNTFPKSLLVIGDEGSGKHLLVNEIAKRLNLQIVELDEGISLDTINEIYISVLPCIYMLDMDVISKTRRNDIQQNKILKLLEEPPKAAFIILLSESKTTIIDTILNRCQVWKMDPYSENERQEIYGKADNFIEKGHRFITQPGQLINASTNNLDYLDTLTSNIRDNIYRANTSNILTIKDRINFCTNYSYINENDNLPLIGDKNTVYIDTVERCRYKYEHDSYEPVEELDISIFLSYLKGKLIDSLSDNYSDYCLSMIQLTEKLSNDLKILNVDKKLLFENYLVNLKLLPYGH